MYELTTYLELLIIRKADTYFQDDFQDADSQDNSNLLSVSIESLSLYWQIF